MTKYVVIMQGEHIIGATPVYNAAHEAEIRKIFTEDHTFTEIPKHVCTGIKGLIDLAIENENNRELESEAVEK